MDAIKLMPCTDMGKISISIGKNIAAALTHPDISERKSFEEALRLSEERFSKVFHANPLIMGISILDTLIFIDVNDSFCRFFGYGHDEAITRSTLDLNIWANPADQLALQQAILTTGSIHDKEYVFRHKSGELRLGLFSAETIFIGDEKCVLGMVIDITERQRMKSEMIRLDRLNLVGQIAASIGHEVRNPMTTVRGFLQMLRNVDKYADESDTFDLMIEELDRANSIISEFLSIARNKPLALKMNSLNAIVLSMLPLFQVHAISQDKVIEAALSNIPPLLVDEKEIRQLLLNLVHNGLDAMSPGGMLTIRTIDSDGIVVLSIQDDGSGIPPEVMKKLGTPFFTTKENGTGLGIAVCYSIAARHQAAINIETGSAGTTFNICFPIRLD